MDMQLARTPVTSSPDFREATPLPATLPAPTKCFALRNAPTMFVGRSGYRDRVGTEQVFLSANYEGWITHGSFDQAVSSAHELAGRLGPQLGHAGSIGIVQGHDGWLLLRAGTVNSTYTDDPRVTSFSFEPALDGTAAVVRRTKGDLLAIVGTDRWVDFRTPPAA
jgi:hypothetical protein